MATKWLHSRTGIGFSPGAVTYIILRGLNANADATLTGPVCMTISHSSIYTATVASDSVYTAVVSHASVYTATVEDVDPCQ